MKKLNLATMILIGFALWVMSNHATGQMTDPLRPGTTGFSQPVQIIHLDGVLDKISQLTQAPKVQEPLPAIPVEAINVPTYLYITAPPSSDQTVAALRREASAEYEEMQSRLWQVSLQGERAILSFQGRTTAAEDLVREARSHCARYLDLQRQIEALTGEKAEADRRYKERLEHLTVFPNGPYTVHTSDSTVINRYYPIEAPKSTPQKDQPRGTHWEDRCGVEKCLVKVGFDKNGNPFYKMGYDVVRKKVEVPNNLFGK